MNRNDLATGIALLAVAVGLRLLSPTSAAPSIGRIYLEAGKRRRRCKSGKYSDAAAGACSHHQGLQRNQHKRDPQEIQWTALERVRLSPQDRQLAEAAIPAGFGVMVSGKDFYGVQKSTGKNSYFPSGLSVSIIYNTYHRVFQVKAHDDVFDGLKYHVRAASDFQTAKESVDAALAFIQKQEELP